MKKCITILLALLYMGNSAGATIHLHYCMGEFINASFTDTNAETCGKCGMQSHNTNEDCCKDVSIEAKITDSHFSYRIDYKIDKYYEITPPSFYCSDLAWFFKTDIAHNSFKVHAPPDIGNLPLYIQHRNFRI
jgi:hypothetical protein